MTDASTTIKDIILNSLEQSSQDGNDPRPPSSYFMASIEMMAMSVFENNRPLTAWLKERGLDPHKGHESVLGLGLLLILDAKRHPQPELEHFEMPDDHHH